MKETDGPQKHIVNSYKFQGGHASKWATEWQKGRPDLITTLPTLGPHFVEVKWLRNYRWGEIVKNPMELKQKDVAKEWMVAGAWVACGLVVGDKTLNSYLCYFNPLLEFFELTESRFVKYVPGQGYDVKRLQEEYTRAYSESEGSVRGR